MCNLGTVCTLSSNDYKGYSFEVTKVQKLLRENNIPFEGNPSDPRAWKRNIAKGVDIKLPSLDLEIECKYVTVDVWPSSINYHYIPRFSGSKYKVTVTNDLRKFSSKCRDNLKKNGIKLLNPIYLMQFIYRLMFKRRANTISYLAYVSHFSSVVVSFSQPSKEGFWFTLSQFLLRKGRTL